VDGTVSTSSHWKKIGAEFLAIFAGVVLGLLADNRVRKANAALLKAIREDIR
jgi:hypothetical protein